MTIKKLPQNGRRKEKIRNALTTLANAVASFDEEVGGVAISDELFEKINELAKQYDIKKF